MAIKINYTPESFLIGGRSMGEPEQNFFCSTNGEVPYVALLNHPPGDGYTSYIRHPRK